MGHLLEVFIWDPHLKGFFPCTKKQESLSLSSLLLSSSLLLNYYYYDIMIIIIVIYYYYYDYLLFIVLSFWLFSKKHFLRHTSLACIGIVGVCW